MAKRVLIALLVIGVFALVGCSALGSKKADSNADILGTWQRVGGGSGGYCQYADDGTYLCARTLEEISSNEGFAGVYWFEGDHYFDQIPGNSRCPGVGIYEIQIQSNGNLKFILVEDELVRLIGLTPEGKDPSFHSYLS